MTRNRSLAILAAAAFLVGPVQAQCLLDQTTASDADQSDFYGGSVSAWGRFVIVGAEYADSGGFDQGQVYVLERVGDQWVETQILTHSDAGFDHRFGHATSIWENRIVAGARYNDDFGYGTGSAYVFDFDGNTWTQTAKLLPSDAALGDLAGGSVAVFGDRVLVSAHGDDPNGADKAGAVYAFEFDGKAWNEVQWLVASDADPDDRFGEHIAMWQDRAIFGALADDGLAENAGAAYVFEIGPDGKWFEAAKLTAPDGAEFDRMGNSVDIWGDLAIVGASLSGAQFQGSAYIFERTENGAWKFLQKLEPEGDPAGGAFGHHVVVFEDRIMVTAQNADLGDINAAGAASIYRRQADGLFALEAYLQPKQPNIAMQFGSAGDLFRDLVAVGVRGSEVAAGYKSGEVDLFGGTGTTTQYLDACPGEISLQTGGAQVLSIEAGPDQADRVFLVLGSLEGTSPGIALDGYELPLVPDAYFLLTLDPNAPSPLVGSFGLLDASGSATTTFEVSPGTDASLAGLTAYHALLVLDPATLALRLVSDAVSVTLVP
ncbi:FG-GAP repeat protein [Engelhardtia mirabilis]|uniref:FG-GAP repeat protein n=1 Tax=Engelhardtia mirabilis TaxID=2528011 RepID=A0A518BFQ0_9BACT|nr:hypothetical protein Pla133_08520 [Planctomycetes bacterium Pla133]QDV00112.1 hypothetical protein Pla86_08510 [Planctomycetes bacterium Pla86]